MPIFSINFVNWKKKLPLLIVFFPPVNNSSPPLLLDKRSVVRDGDNWTYTFLTEVMLYITVNSICTTILKQYMQHLWVWLAVLSS